jgi:hypothetical protein
VPTASACIGPLRLPSAAPGWSLRLLGEGVVPLPLTDLIEQELLATLDGEGDPDAVLSRHAGSKGPLYAALARATAAATARFGEVRDKLREAQARLRDTEKSATEAEKRASQTERRASAAEKRLASAESALAERQVLLDRADALRAAGFEADALARLGEALAGAAQAEEKPAAEVVAAFLNTAADWRRLAELRAQVAAAEEKARATEAACRRKEQQANVRSVAVDWAVWLVSRKITAEAVGAWQAIAAKLGIADEDLAAGLAGALEEYGSLQAARQAWSAAVAKLRADHTKLTGEVTALRRERDGLTAAIGAVRDAGIAEVREVAEAATAEVRRAAAEFERIQAQAAGLANHVRMAQALTSDDHLLWQRVEPETWAGLLVHLVRWADARLVSAVEVEPPEAVKSRLEDQVRCSYTKGPLRLTLPQLVGWLAAGLQGAPLRGVAALLGPASADGARPRG